VELICHAKVAPDADAVGPRLRSGTSALIARAGEGGVPVKKRPAAGRILDSSKLADVFGIDLRGGDLKPSHKPGAKKTKSRAPRVYKSAKPVGKRSARKKSGQSH
jgi:hypothetical protein